MNPAPPSRKRATLRALAGAAISACLVATIGLVSSSAAEPAGAMAAADDTASAQAAHDEMGQRWSRHVQAHLDMLSERLEIKASQEPAWQKFAAAFRDNLNLHAMFGHMAGSAGAGDSADAATLARQQADRAKEHAQKLAQLADATAALQQVLGPEQRQVFNEAARHFAHEHGGMDGMRGMGYGGWHGAMADHCERGPHGDAHDGYEHPHGHWDHGDDPHGAMMAPEPEAPAAHGDAAH